MYRCLLQFYFGWCLSFTGAPLNVNLPNIAFHFGYMIGYAASFGLDVDWYAPVYWTLQYELQFYILVAIVFPLVKAAKRFFHRISFFAVFFGLQVSQLGLSDAHSLPLVYRFADMFFSAFSYFREKLN